MRGIRVIEHGTVTDITETDVPAELLGVAVQANGVPPIGTPHATWPIARVVDHVGTGFSTRSVELRMIYESPPGFGTRHQENLWYEEKHTALREELTGVDIHEYPLLTIYAPQGGGENKLSFKARRPVAMTTIILTGVFTTGFPEPRVQGCINSTRWRQYGPGTVLCMNVQEFDSVRGQTWLRRAQFLYSPFGWDHYERRRDPYTGHAPTDITPESERAVRAYKDLPWRQPPTLGGMQDPASGQAQYRLNGLTRARILYAMNFVQLFGE